MLSAEGLIGQRAEGRAVAMAVAVVYGYRSHLQQGGDEDSLMAGDLLELAPKRAAHMHPNRKVRVPCQPKCTAPHARQLRGA